MTKKKKKKTVADQENCRSRKPPGIIDIRKAQEGSGRLRLVIYVYINDDSLLGKVIHD